MRLTSLCSRNSLRFPKLKLIAPKIYLIQQRVSSKIEITKKTSPFLKRVQLVFTIPEHDLHAHRKGFPQIILFHSNSAFNQYCYFIIQYFDKASLYVKVC